MAGLDPAIHGLRHERKQDVDARIKSGHDECRYGACGQISGLALA
jgi:hypothetical protein